MRSRTVDGDYRHNSAAGTALLAWYDWKAVGLAGPSFAQTVAGKAPATQARVNVQADMDLLVSEEGNKVFNDDPGGVHLYDTSRLPNEYQPTKPENAARRAESMKLLGIQ